MPSMNFQVKVQKNMLPTIMPRIVGIMTPTLVQISADMLAEAILLCPKRYGYLRGSGQLGQPDISGDSIKMEIGFGNASVDYAIVVHEDLSKYHPVGQAKYLETAVLHQTAKAQSMLSRAFGIALRP